jgi:hypothetical protein
MRDQLLSSVIAQPTLGLAHHLRPHLPVGAVPHYREGQNSRAGSVFSVRAQRAEEFAYDGRRIGSSRFLGRNWLRRFPLEIVVGVRGFRGKWHGLFVRPRLF